MTAMQRFFVEILRRETGRSYLPTGQASEVIAMDEWDAGRKFFASLGLISLPTPAFALRVRRLDADANAGTS
jgi:hypothetical protein